MRKRYFALAKGVNYRRGGKDIGISPEERLLFQGSQASEDAEGSQNTEIKVGSRLTIAKT